MPNSKPLRVLIVEDEAVVAMLLEDMVEELGHELAGTAGAFDAALDLARAAEADFAIIDVNLNGERSYPIAEALRARGVPFAFATGYDPEGLASDWADAAILAKPYQRDDLKRLLDQAAA